MRLPEEPRLPSLTSDATSYDKNLSIRLKELFSSLIKKANQFETGSQAIKLGSNSDESKNFLISVPSVADGTLVIERGNGADVMRFGSDNSGQLAGFRNILINGDMRINQRGVTIAAAANGAYGPDRWKKVDASSMTQIVESSNFKVSTLYTLSGTGVTTQQITSPASGHWTLPNIPITATKIQLEEGSIATPFEQRPIGLELSLCERYYEHVTGVTLTTPYSTFMMRQTKRAVPTLSLVSISIGTGFGATSVDTKSIYQSNAHSTNASFILAASAEL